MVNDVKIVSILFFAKRLHDLIVILQLGDPCASQPCMNQGSCMRENGSFLCACPPGYSGSRCEIQDPCQNNPCMNGATC
ncbi:unnamed protein product, partial [Rotaria magnacalcarata]